MTAYPIPEQGSFKLVEITDDMRIKRLEAHFDDGRAALTIEELDLVIVADPIVITKIAGQMVAAVAKDLNQAVEQGRNLDMGVGQ